VIFQDFPGNGILKKKIQDFPGGMGILFNYSNYLKNFFKLIENVLCVPAMSVLRERLFSSASFAVNKTHSLFDPHM